MFGRKSNRVTGTAAAAVAAVAAAVSAAVTLSVPPAVADPVYPAVPAPQESTDGTGPGAVDARDAEAQAAANPRMAPVGADDWGCVPTAEHPDPVVLVHGTWSNAYASWSGLAPVLAADGYCVFTPNLGEADLSSGGGVRSLQPGVYATKDIAASAADLADYVDAVLAATGARQVDMVGHSQGCLLARQYLKFNGGAGKVRHLVTLGATNHGTTMAGIGTLDRTVRDVTGVDLDPVLDTVVGQAGIQQVYGSPLLTALNEGGDTVPGVGYTVIGSRYDQVSTPYEATFLTAGPGATVDNITVQDGCEADLSGHGMTYSPRVIDLVRDALTPGSVAQVRCVPVAPAS